MPQPKKSAKRPAHRAISAGQAMLAANKYLLFHYPTMFTGALPRRLKLPTYDVWIVPIVLTHPDRGIIGEAGLVAVDAHSGQVVGSTPRAEVVAAGKRLREAKHDALETAVLPTRTV
jgi:hypothetical protein